MVTFNHFSPNCTLPNERPIGFVNAPNILTTMQIVWSCFSVILLCTWSILHLNVPPELTTKNKLQWTYRKLFLLFRKVYWMGVMLIAPEFLTTFMTKKILGTKKNVKVLEEIARHDGVEWTLSHTILADMGGIAIYFGPLPRRLSKDPLKEKLSKSPGALEALLSKEKAFMSKEKSEEEVKKSEKEMDKVLQEYEFIKTFMRGQNRWLGGCDIPWKPFKEHLPRAKKAKESLPKESLEWKTENIAALAGNVWTLDSKQLEIARLHGIIDRLPSIQLADIEDKNKSDPLVKLLAMMQVIWIVVQLCARVYYRLPFAPLELTTVAFPVTAIIVYSSEWEKPKDVNTPVYVPAAGPSVTEEAFMEIVEAAPFPYMQFPYLQCKHYYMPSVSFHETDGKVSHIDAKSFLVALATVVSFGGIHLFAWNFHFPTPIEGLLWKISAIITIACPTLYVSSHLPFIGKSPKDVSQTTAMMATAVVGLTSFVYFFARLFLITESIRSLYYLPREAFIATPWTADFPHMA